MKNKNCLSERDLILHYYGELSANDVQAHHLADCLLCREHFSALSRDLANFPELPLKLDAAAGTRMAARVSERLNRRSRNWIPALGASLATAVALVITLSIWSPMSQQKRTVQYPVQPLTVASLNEDMPDIDFIEDLELLKELELLSQIEGV